MKEQAILNYGREHYPIGTLIKEANKNKKVIIDDDFNEAALRDNIWLTDNYLICYCKDPETGEKITGCGFYIFEEGQWADIISQPVNNNLILAL